MKGLRYLALVLTVCCILHCTKSAPSPSEVVGNYNALSGRPCIQECQARCGGICYLNMMAFKYVCSCSRMGK